MTIDDITLTLTPCTFDTELPYYKVAFKFYSIIDETKDEIVKIGSIKSKVYDMETLFLAGFTVDDLVEYADDDNADDPVVLGAFRNLLETNLDYMDFHTEGRIITLDTVFVEPKFRKNRLGLQMVEKALDLIKESMYVSHAFLQAAPLSSSLTHEEKTALSLRLANYYKEIDFEVIKEGTELIMMKHLFQRFFI